MLNCKVYGGNLGIKFDVKKAFDTLEWKFLLNVLKSFGFCSTFCGWIKRIIESARLSLAVNGLLCGYLQCKRGVRQGDPLSLMLFCIVEEVLSRGISSLVASNSLLPMASPKQFATPMHIL